jgi:hypothetical protein
VYDLDLQLDDLVLFELPTPACSAAFSARLRSRWPGWSAHDDAGWLFAVDLFGGGELAPLLREAQQLLEALAVPAIQFCLDGRVYTLEAQRSRAREPVPSL